MIVYEISVWQVDLSDGNTKGINWNQLALTGGNWSLGVANPATSTAVGLGAVFSKGKLSVNSVVEFLETQGTVKVVTQPRIAVMSGSKGKIYVGQTTRFVSKVGSNYGVSVNQVTTETEVLKTGVGVQVLGDYHDGTVTTQLNLDIDDLVRMDIRDLPTHGKTMMIHLDVPRLICLACKKTFMAVVAEVDADHAMTERLVRWMGRQSLEAPAARLVETRLWLLDNHKPCSLRAATMRNSFRITYREKLWVLSASPITAACNAFPAVKLMACSSYCIVQRQLIPYKRHLSQ
jgi:hypothetical protein